MTLFSGIFTKYQTNKSHATAPFRTFEVDGLFDCVDACVYDVSCKSINLDKNTDPPKCELVANDRNSQNQYVSAANVTNYDTGKTRITRIYNHDLTRCLVSEDLLCDFTVSWIKVRVETDTNVCNTHRAALFSFDADLGILIHHCSGRIVAPQAYTVNPAFTHLMAIHQNNPPNGPPDIYSQTNTVRRDFSEYLE